MLFANQGFGWRMLEAVQTQDMKCSLAGRDGMHCERCEREKVVWLDMARELSRKQIYVCDVSKRNLRISYQYYIAGLIFWGESQ